MFATCFHLMDEISRLKYLGEDELQKEGLIDKNRRIATFVTDHFEWVAVEPIKYSYVFSSSKPVSIDSFHDI